MYVYFDKNGTIKEVINDLSIRKGSAEANKIYVYVDDTEIDDIWFVARKPDGTLTTEQSFVANTIEKTIPYDAKRDMYYFKDFETYKFYVYTLTGGELSESGLMIATIRIVQDNSIFALGELTFNVQTNVIKEDNNITQSQYDYLLLSFSSLNSLVLTFNDRITNVETTIETKADKNNSSQTIVAGTVEANTLKANTKVISQKIQPTNNNNFYESFGMYQGSDNSLYKRFIIQRKDSTWLPDISQPVYFPFFQLSDDTYHNDGKDNVTGLGLGLRTTNGVKPDFQIIPAFRFSSDWQNFAHDKLEPVYLFRPNLALLPNGQIVTVDNPGVYMQLNSYGEIIIESHGLETSEYSSLNIAQDGISFYLRNEEDGLKETSVTINIDSFHYEQNNINSTTPIPFFDFENGKFTVTNAHFYEGNKQVATQEYVNGEITTLDNDLQSQIDGINAGQNLADIVADLTALNNLPTSNLKADDKVQVLVDSNHDNASTVYNWTGSAWSYIGKYGQDSYTKAEVNTLLNAKQDVIDASHKLNADLVDDTNATNKFVTASEKAQITTNANNISNLRTGSDLTNTLEFTKTVNQSWDYIIQNGLSSTPLISQADFNKLNQNTVIIYNVISSVDNVQFTFYLRCESAIVDQSDMILNYKGTYGLETGDGMFTMEFSADNSLHCDMHLTYTQTYTREDVDTAINNSFLTDAQMTTLLSEVFD